MASYNYTFTSGDTVTPTKLNSARTVSDIVNADIKSDAAIAFSKLAALDSANILVGNGSNVATKVAVTGDVTISNAGVTAIGSGKVLTAMIADDAVTDAKLSLAANAGEIKKALNADNAPPIFACRAWVNFDATRDSSGASNTSNTNRFIRASGNVSSVLKTATGVFTITFTTAMPDEHYAVAGFANWTSSNPAGFVSQTDTFAPTASSCAIRVASSTTAAENNVSHNHVMFVR